MYTLPDTPIESTLFLNGVVAKSGLACTFLSQNTGNGYHRDLLLDDR